MQVGQPQHQPPAGQQGPCAAASSRDRWQPHFPALVNEIPYLARKRKAQQAKVISRAAVEIANLKAAFEDGTVAHASTAIAATNRKLVTQRQHAEKAYAVYRGWNDVVRRTRSNAALAYCSGPAADDTAPRLVGRRARGHSFGGSTPKT
jgi:hypothetical protein